MKFIVTEENRQYEFLLSPGVYIVGRDSTCDLTLGSRHVSRRHMSCTVSEDGIRVKDMGSRNHLYVGSVRVKEALLKDGDEVGVGDAKLVFQASGPSAIPAAGAQAGGEEPLVAGRLQRR